MRGEFVGVEVEGARRSGLELSAGNAGVLVLSSKWRGL